MPELIIHTTQGTQVLSFEGMPVLHDLLIHFPDAPARLCGGTGKCRKCAVLVQGTTNPAPDAFGRVLSCQTFVTGDCEVWLPSKKTFAKIETERSDSSFAFSPFEGTYGAAIDIGTTTVAYELIRLSDGKTLAITSCENPQRVVASDVIGRIESALNGRLSLLQTLIVECILRIETQAFEQAGISRNNADIRVITGNTTMLYLLEGLNPRSLAAAPFNADCLFGYQKEQNILPSCASAFIGADITCALLSSQVCRSNQTILLIDIGTNGEICLWHDGHLTCCATAAGPAFEGCGISCGTGSIPGAIDQAYVENGEIRYTTIAQTPACGICGSGLIDLTAALLDTEQLDETGLLDNDLSLADNITLTQKDIRQVQLAKAAISAGIQTLLQNTGLSEDDVDTLYIAGGFGSHLNLINAAKIGLIPPSLVSKCKVLGNASLAGARQILLSKASFDEATNIAKTARCINLASEKYFTEAFVDCMLFEQTKKSFS